MSVSYSQSFCTLACQKNLYKIRFVIRESMENCTAKLNHIFVTIKKILKEIQNVTFKLAALQKFNSLLNASM